MLEFLILIAFFEAGCASGQNRGYLGPTSGGFVLFAYFAGAWSWLILGDPVIVASGVGNIVAMLVGSTAAFIALFLLRIRRRRNLRRILEKKSYFPHRGIGLLILLIGVIQLLGNLAQFAFVAMFSAVVFLFLSVDACRYCFYVHRRKVIPNIDDVTRHDPRPVILFLRSFALDEKRDSSNLTFQELIGPGLFMEVGPFVAFGNPDEPLPSTGAAKDFVPDVDWIQEMQQRVDSAGIVLIVAGEGEGLRTELAYIANNKDPTRVLMITPSEEFSPPLTRLIFYNMLVQMGWRLPTDLPEPSTLMVCNAKKSISYIKIDSAHDLSVALANRVPGSGRIPEGLSLGPSEAKMVIEGQGAPRYYTSIVRERVGYLFAGLLLSGALDILLGPLTNVGP